MSLGMGGLSLCALIRVQLHTKVAHGACKTCALIRVVHLSGVHLSGFYCIEEILHSHCNNLGEIKEYSIQSNPDIRDPDIRATRI